MSRWEDFEFDCTNFLNDRFGAYATFYHEGGSDSTKPDIRVETKGNKTFYMEAKHCPAQCGQFVLLPNISTRKFEYSSSNAREVNSSAQKIMDFMNKNFDEFRNAGTAGKDIVLQNGSEIFSEWIIQTYKEKRVRFFITNNFRIIDINNFSDCFNVSAKYRIKRSGSSNVGKTRLKSISDYLKNYLEDISIDPREGNLFITSSLHLHNMRFNCGNYEYMISERGDVYEVRKLSNTYNANVIFSIDIKNQYTEMSERDFIAFLSSFF